MLDDRAKLLLKALVERYIADGQPIGSRTLSKASGLELSPATIRNVMSDLEELGLIASPHTSAGRIPTTKGYRLFVDTMLSVQRETLEAPHSLVLDQPQKVITSAASLLSKLSQFVGVVVAPKRSSVFKHIEFMRLSEKRLLVILVTPEGDVQNRVIFTEREYSSSELIEASNFLIKRQEIEQVAKNRRLNVSYPNHKEYNEAILPLNILIEAIHENEKNTISLDYNSVTFNEQLSFPFSVPSDYEQIFIEN